MKTITIHAGETITLGNHSIRLVKHGFHAEGQGPRVQTVELEVDELDDDDVVTTNDAVQE